jgi:hypothetical protein
LDAAVGIDDGAREPDLEAIDADQRETAKGMSDFGKGVPWKERTAAEAERDRHLARPRRAAAKGHEDRTA